MGNPETYKTSWCWKFVGIYSFYKTWLGISFCCSRMSWFLRHVSSKMKNKHLRKKLREPWCQWLQLHQFHLFHDQKRDPSLDVSTIFLIKESTNNTFFFPQLTCYPSLSDRTAGKSHHQWKNNIYGFSFGYATICNLHMPTSTPSKDNILAPTSSCTWPKQCKAGVICESRSNRAWHPQWKKPSWPSLKGWNRLLTTVFLIVDAYWCLLMGDVIMNLMAEPEMWKWLWINMPVRQHDMRKTSAKTKTWFTLTYI